MKAIATVFAVILLLALEGRGADPRASSDVGRAMIQAARDFLASLDDAGVAKATMKFDDPARLDWHNIPKPKRKGVQLRDMTPEQRERCHALLRAALSDVGFEKALRILSLENNLREGEKGIVGGPLRDPDRYFLTIFGKPESTGVWGWSFEGHHFSLNFVIEDGQVVSDTPSFWGANPATVRVFVEGGPAVGVRTLAQEEQSAFDLVQSLSEEQRKRALIAPRAPAEYRGGGTPQPPQSPPAGLVASAMNDEQRKILWSLLEAYCGNLEAPLAAARLAEIKSAGFEKVHFAWAGATRPGVGHYYRVQGPTFVLELVNVQSDPAGNKANHIHSVWRNMKGDFGIPLEKKVGSVSPAPSREF